jgi:hypothetical protein
MWPDRKHGFVNYLLMTVGILAWYYSYTYAENTKPTITPFESSTGLYLDEIGNVFFYPTQWKIVSYVDLKPTQRVRTQVKPHQFQIFNYCTKIRNTTWYPMTNCSGFTPYIRTKTPIHTATERCHSRLFAFQP